MRLHKKYSGSEDDDNVKSISALVLQWYKLSEKYVASISKKVVEKKYLLESTPDVERQTNEIQVSV